MGIRPRSKKNVFLWYILQPGVCCNIPYFLTRFLDGSAISSRLGSPICGSHFITRLARSYVLIVPEITRSLTCMEDNEFSMGYLETMRVVRNFGSHWGLVHTDDEGDHGEHPGAQSEQQPQPRPRRRNVQGRREREGSQCINLHPWEDRILGVIWPSISISFR